MNANGLQPDPAKVETIKNYPTPKNLRAVRRFNGMATWYCRYIQNFAKISEPLNELKHENRRWNWGEDQQKVMDTLKENLTTVSILACPDFSLPFSLQTDACPTDIGAALT